jgi:GNAT superfamily N-acetyltransferase
MRELTITHADREWHEAFLEFVPRVFPSISFRRWVACGGWDAGYRAFALADGDRIVASSSLARVDLVLRGQPVRGWQLGAVGTDPAYRRRGLQRNIMTRLLAQCPPDDLVFLFANDSVLDFYPRFGFQRRREHLFGAEHHAAPSGTPLRALDVTSAEDRALLLRIAAQAEPITSQFGARAYGTTLLWYLCNFQRDHVRYVAEHDSIIVGEQVGATLHLYDVVTSAPFDLAQQLPHLIDAPIEHLEFAFTPSRDWPSAKPTREYTESALFTRGPHRLPESPFKFPTLAQT